MARESGESEIRRRPRGRTKRWLLPVFGAVLAIVLMELGSSLVLHLMVSADQEPPVDVVAQIQWPVRELESVPDPFTLNRAPADVDLGWVRTNSYGLRGGPIERTPADSTYRILCLGGSIVWGHTSTSNADTIPSYLEELLVGRAEDCAALRGKTVEVLNGGVTGYVAWQDALAYATRLRELRPRIVVLLDGHNEVYMALQTSGAGVPGLFPKVTEAMERHSGGLLASLGHWFDRRLSRSKTARVFARLKSTSVEELGVPPPEEVTIAYREALECVADLCRADGALTLGVLQPCLFVEDAKRATVFEQGQRDLWERRVRGSLDYYDDCFVQFGGMLEELDAARPDFRGLNLGREFANDSEPIYVDSCHLTPAGRRRVASRLADAIVEMLERP